jgi:hypothetical protein
MADKKKIDAAALLEVLPDQNLRTEVTAMTGEPITSPDLARVEKDLLRRLKEFEVARRIIKVKAEMQGVNPALQPDLHDELFSRLLKLEAERRENKTRGD